MGKPRFIADNLLTDPAMLTVSSARAGERGAATPEVLGGGSCYAQGDYTGDLAIEQFVVEIDSVTAGNGVGQATFRWKGGPTATWEANGVATSGSLIALRDGISVRFGGSGFIKGDRWLIEARRTFGRASLLDPDPDMEWRATGCAGEWVRADLGVPAQVAAMILGHHNLSAGASAVLKASGIAHEPIWSFDPAGGELVDSLGNPGVNARATGRTYIDGGVLKYAEPGESCFEDGKLSIQPAATNLLPYSDDLDNASAWSAVNAAVTAEGGLFRLTNNSTFDYHYLTPNTKTVGESTTNTMSVDAKAGTAGVLIISEAAGSWNRVRFNLNSGVIESEDNATGKIVALADGWYRCSATFTTPVGQPYVVWWLEVALQGNGYGSYVGSGEYIYLRRPQLEVGPVPTAYIPTTAAPASRDADAISFPMPSAVAAALGAAGSVAAEWTPGFDWDEMPAVAYHSVVSCADAALSLLSIRKDASYFRIVTYDGAYLVEKYASPAYGNAYDLAARWGSSSQYQVGYGSSWGTANTFDGAYAAGSKINFGYGVTLPFHLGRVKIFDQWLDGAPQALMDPWDYPAYSQALSITRPHLVLFLDQTHRFWRLELADPDNPDGYLRASLFYLGGFTQLSRGMLQGADDTLRAAANKQEVAGGLVGGTVGEVGDARSFAFNRLLSDDRDALRSLYRRLHEQQMIPLWFLPDAEDPAGLLYGFLEGALSFKLSNPGRYAVRLGFREWVR
jgi:hypothetical protein